MHEQELHQAELQMRRRNQAQDPAAFNATAKGMSLHPKTMGIAMDKLSDKPAGMALPKTQILPLNLPPRPLSGSGT